MVKVELRKFRFPDYLRVLFMMLDKQYSQERDDTFFRYLKKGFKSVQQRDSYEFSILVNGKFAGNIGLIKSKKGPYEIGYMVLRKYRSKGITTKAVEKILKFGFIKLKIKKVIAITDLKNGASQRVLRKNKFKIIKRDKKLKELSWEVRKW